MKTLNKPVVREGSFKEAILNGEPTYDMYITSDNSMIHVDNELNTNGKRVLLIKDSFAVPVAAWLSCIVDELWIVDLRYEQTASVKQYIQDYEIDTVIVLYNPDALNSEVFFNYNEVSKGS